MIRLSAVIEIEGQAPRALTYESSASAFTLGRDASADFQIPLTTISRQHSRISEADGLYVIEDLGSTHGTIVNGKKLGKGEKKVIKDGDMLELTKAKIKVSIENQSPGLMVAAPGEGTQAIAARAVQGILGRLGEARSDGPYFRILNGADEGTRFPLSGSYTEWTFGRSKDCEFVLNDPNVSRRHARVKKDWNGFMIEDLGSKNGVLVNDQLIKKARRLKDRDEITVGPVKAVYIDPDAELLAALKDVPGFSMEEPSDAEPMAPDASHMGAPLDQSAGDAPSPMGEPTGGTDEASLDAPESIVNSPHGTAALDDAELEAEIDPELLKDFPSKPRVEWLVIGVVGLVLLGCVVLMLAIFA